MRVLQHFQVMNSPPVGVWWVNEVGLLSCAYSPDTDAEERIGRLTMTYRAPEATWDEFFDCLERHIPIGSYWESVEILNIEPQEYLHRLRTSKGGQRT